MLTALELYEAYLVIHWELLQLHWTAQCHAQPESAVQNFTTCRINMDTSKDKSKLWIIMLNIRLWFWWRLWRVFTEPKSISVLGKSKSKSYFITDSEPWSCHFLHLAVEIQVWCGTRKCELFYGRGSFPVQLVVSYQMGNEGTRLDKATNPHLLD